MQRAHYTVTDMKLMRSKDGDEMDKNVKDIAVALAWLIGICMAIVVAHVAGVLDPYRGAATMQLGLLMAYAVVIGSVFTALSIGGLVVWFRR